MVDYMNHRLWKKIVENGDFHTMAAPFGIKIFFFGQEFMINNIETMRPRLGLFHDRYPHSCQARMQLTMTNPHFILISQVGTDSDGKKTPSEDIETTLQYGDPITQNIQFLAKETD